ncbi:hypothetical protein J0A68_18165 [Algoriphagus sp. H41]|uniref:Uncharacterized protein n=1 Tax=Algoriphagus oliviformis TaxID=2811231 RepID=A0ABS3C6Y3_9BACT|nr:hypothetical protein [Algoriphagus oliviformis]MBN7812887.1 hypothetical protein [Algoriphagus oliviformis]
MIVFKHDAQRKIRSHHVGYQLDAHEDHSRQHQRKEIPELFLYQITMVNPQPPYKENDDEKTLAQHKNINEGQQKQKDVEQLVFEQAVVIENKQWSGLDEYPVDRSI